MKVLSSGITKWCQKYCGLNEDEYTIVQYGIENSLNTSTKIVILLIVGAMIHRFWETVITLTVFCSLRSFAGGHHCKSHMGCLGSMLLISLSPMVFESVDSKWALPIEIAMTTYSIYAFIQYAPRNSEVNPIYDENILRIKRRGSLIACGIVVFLIVIILEDDFRSLIVLPLFAEAITISPLFYKKKQ